MIISELKWFIEQTKENKIEIILIALVCLLLFVVNVQNNKINSFSDVKHRTDSLYITRVTDIKILHQKELQKCNEDRIREKVQEVRELRIRFEELHRETDRMYQKFNMK